MKETQSASLASQSFVFEVDAYQALKEYLGDIASRLPAGEEETLEDVEDRLAEIFREQLSSPMMVVTDRMVREAINQMGDPAAFGDRRIREEQPKEEGRRHRLQHLHRSQTDRVLAGVCGGLANHFHIDPALLRLVTLLLIIFGGLSVWIYIILWVIIPEEPIEPQASNQPNSHNP